MEPDRVGAAWPARDVLVMGAKPSPGRDVVRRRIVDRRQPWQHERRAGRGDDLNKPPGHQLVVGGVFDVEIGRERRARRASTGVELEEVEKVDLGPVVDPDPLERVAEVRGSWHADPCRLEDDRKVAALLLVRSGDGGAGKYTRSRVAVREGL